MFFKIYLHDDKNLKSEVENLYLTEKLRNALKYSKIFTTEKKGILLYI